MKKGKKIYNLTIMYNDETEEVEYLMEEVYHDDRVEPFAEYEEPLGIPEITEHPSAPPDMLKEIIDEYYFSLIDDSGIFGLA